MQIPVNCERKEDRGNDITFLENRLEPSVQEPMDDGWLKGSRKTVMDDVDDWLKDCDKPNVLWISGAPGAGKSAIASAIVRKKLSEPNFAGTHSCVEFFIKRGKAGLDDPRTIWRSIAMGLASLFLTDGWYRSIKVDILEAISRKANLYPKNVAIEDQFRDLICDPLKGLFEPTANPSSSRRVVIVIDALDECNLLGTSAFLDTVARWSAELPGTCKLVLTSRVESGIEKKLEGFHQPLVLDTGDDVSNESTSDIKLLFNSKKGFKKEVEQEKIEKLAKYAAGLFIWATTVIEYVNRGDFDDRLKDVLANMPAAGGRGGNSDKIGILYGQILFKVGWERRGHPNELDRLSLALASVIPGILRRPLSMHALGALLSPSPEAIDGVADGLKPVIASDGADEPPRIRHKSFLDFLLDEQRVIAVMKHFIKVEGAEDSDQSGFLDAFSLVHQRALLPTSCLRLMVQCIEDNGSTAPLNADILTALVYACTHWVDHMSDVEARSEVANGETHVYSDPCGETLSSLQKRTLKWLEEESRRRRANQESGAATFVNVRNIFLT